MTFAAARKLIQLIHIGKAQLGLDEDTYRAVLHQVTGLESCSALSVPQLEAVLKHLQDKGFKPTARKTFAGRPHNADADNSKSLLKIEALLTDAGQPWAYAEAMLKHMTKGRKARMAFASGGELHAIIAALHKAACKRLAAELQAAFGPHWEHLGSTYAALLFDLPWAHTLSRYPEPMSKLLRWWRGELQVVCEWPVDLGKPKCCSRCYEWAEARAMASRRSA